MRPVAYITSICYSVSRNISTVTLKSEKMSCSVTIPDLVFKLIYVVRQSS